MTTLPITRMTLYKHGVGYFERRARLEGAEVSLSFRVEEMNDLLKSLTVIDWGEGQVLGIDYATPQSREERLAGNSIRLGDTRSLRDLLAGLRGREVRLLLDQEETLAGTLLGLDELPEEQPLGDSLVSLLLSESTGAGDSAGSGEVRAVPLKRLRGVEILSDQAAGDLRFFLQTALSQDDFRQVTIRLSAGEHDLSVSYVAPAPTWRVSYRLVAGPEAEEALLLGWGIFDNRMEEDLEEISLSLVAGMPISFIYDLYTPFTPERPEVEEEARVAAAPVDFAGAVPEAEEVEERRLHAARPREMAAMAAPAPAARRRMSRKELREAAPVTTSGQDLGELFQYNIDTPVTVGRGHSAMVPIVSDDLAYHKQLLYNGAKLPTHPVASLRLDNTSGLTLERGPVTVIEGGEYVGEAILPFTAAGAEFLVPYAVELNVHVREDGGTRREIRGLSISGAYLVVEEWDIRWREYQLNNSAGRSLSILVEHPRSARYDLFDTPEPAEKSDEHFRFAVELPAHGERTLRVGERRLLSRREQLERQSYVQLSHYLRDGLLDRETHARLEELLRLWEQIQEQQRRLQEVEQERQQVYQMQKQIQGNMGALSQTGREGTLRTRYVNQLEESEEQLQALAREEESVREEIERLEAEVKERIRRLNQ